MFGPDSRQERLNSLIQQFDKMVEETHDYVKTAYQSGRLPRNVAGQKAAVFIQIADLYRSIDEPQAADFIMGSAVAAVANSGEHENFFDTRTKKMISMRMEIERLSGELASEKLSDAFKSVLNPMPFPDFFGGHTGYNNN